jgi:hypothetical protein
MSPVTYDFEIFQYADFSRTLSWSDSTGAPISLAGYTAACQAKHPDGKLVIDFAADGVLTVSQATSGDTVGQVVIALPGSFTGTLSFADTIAYDLLLTGPVDTGPTNAGSVNRLVQGTITLSKGITA